jgi:hypothetical protein
MCTFSNLLVITTFRRVGQAHLLRQANGLYCSLEDNVYKQQHIKYLNFMNIEISR